jgi:hydrogenase maturation protein HypF
VAAIVGVPGSRQTTYEGQAAVELELAAGGPVSRGYPFRLRPEGEGWVVETSQIVGGVVEAMLAEKPTATISSRFHRTMADVVVAGCERIREAGGVSAVVLSGGTFQNLLLVGQVVELLAGKGFVIYRHRRVPTNDGGLALGQAVLANSFFRGKGT